MITTMNQTHATPSSEEGEDAWVDERLQVWNDEDRWKQEVSVKTLHGKVILIRYDRTKSHTLDGWIKHLSSNKERDINHQIFNFLFDGVTIADLKKRIQEIEGNPIDSRRLASTRILENDEPITFDIIKSNIHLIGDTLLGDSRTKLMARYGEDYDPNYEDKLIDLYGDDYDPNYEARKKRRLAILYGTDYDPDYKQNKRNQLASRYGKDYDPNYNKKNHGEHYDPKYKHNKRKRLALQVALQEAQRPPLPSPDYTPTSPAYSSDEDDD
jgi:hypothetical protein